jgi:MFS family permease
MQALWRAIPARGSRVDPQTAIATSKQARRNFSLGVANGIIAGLLDPLCGVFVLTLFLTRLNLHHFWIGLLPAIASCGGLLPQLIVAGRVRGKKRVMHWYKWSAVGRVSGLAGMALSACFVSAGEGAALVGLFFSFMLYSLCSGISGIPFVEVVGKIVPPHRKGTFYGMRQFGASVMSMLASGVVGAVMSERLGLVFPFNFAAMFGSAAVVGAVVFALWTSVREPDLEAANVPETGSIFRHGVQALRDNREYRLLTSMRLLGVLSGIANPFYVVYATKEMHVPVGAMALFLMLQTGVGLISGLVWTPIANKAPRRTLVLITAALQLAVPATALAAGLIAWLVPAGWEAYAVAPVFIVGSMSTSAGAMFNDTVLLSIAPPGERPTYFGLLNTMAGVACLALPLGGLLTESFGYSPLFAISAVMAILSLAAGTRIGKPTTARKRVMSFEL